MWVVRMSVRVGVGLKAFIFWDHLLYSFQVTTLELKVDLALLTIESIDTETVFSNVFTSVTTGRWTLDSSGLYEGTETGDSLEKGLHLRLFQIELSPGPGTPGSPRPPWRAHQPRSSSPPGSALSMSTSWNKQKLSMDLVFFLQFVNGFKILLFVFVELFCIFAFCCVFFAFCPINLSLVFMMNVALWLPAWVFWWSTYTFEIIFDNKK